MTAKNGIHAAFVKAQAEMTNPKKVADNPFFKSKYADLTQCWQACKGALAEHGIGVMQGVFGDRLQTTLIHESGETLNDEGIQLCGYAKAKNPMQAMGAAITYARRYGLCAMLGMAPEDDDGNSLAPDDNLPADTIDTIDKEGRDNILRLLEITGKDAANFCKAMGFSSIPGIPSSKYLDAVRQLEIKRDKMGAGK
jgi:hypothetical protein